MEIWGVENFEPAVLMCLPIIVGLLFGIYQRLGALLFIARERSGL
jgi:hypothetical protein